jgi:hypothetical protein
MGSLRSALDEMAVQDLRGLTDDELVDHLAEIERATRVLDAERARAIADIEDRRTYAVDGFVSTTAWLSQRFGIAGSAAAQQVRLARALPRMPVTRAALADGAISTVAALLLVDAREADPAQFGPAEATLVEAGRTLPVRDLRRAVDHWKQLADAAREDDVARRRFERRGLFVSATMDGMVRLDGDLDPETGQTVLTAVRSMVDATSRGADDDDRRPAQRRADALGEICRRYLDSADRAVVAGERPHVTLTVDLAAMRRGAVGSAEFTDTGLVTTEAVRRLGCDASLVRVVTNGDSELLDVGRQTPVVPAAIRRALVVRDRGCRFPGCDRPDGWCDAHHVVHWADGGETSLSNLVLLCRRHHRLTHERFGLRMVNGGPVFTREDGSILKDRAPP